PGFRRDDRGDLHRGKRRRRGVKTHHFPPKRRPDGAPFLRCPPLFILARQGPLYYNKEIQAQAIARRHPMLRIDEIHLAPGEPETLLPERAARRLHLSAAALEYF